MHQAVSVEMPVHKDQWLVYDCFKDEINLLSLLRLDNHYRIVHSKWGRKRSNKI